MTDSQKDLYIKCITKQLEEMNLLSSIYCASGELEILEPSVICNFNEFLKNPTSEAEVILEDNLEFTVKLPVLDEKEKIEVRIELPLLYPTLENALVTIHTPLLSKAKEIYFRKEIDDFIASMEKSDTYIFQVITWIQGKIDELIESNDDDNHQQEVRQPIDGPVDFQRLWIYSHHIKSKTKRHEIIKQARNLDLTGFSRPGKPGIICVEGLQDNTQEFWRIIKSMHWQKISICKSEDKVVEHIKMDNLRRFDGFKEQLYANESEEEDAGVMDMAFFIKYLEAHHSGYMKKELFGVG